MLTTDERMMIGLKMLDRLRSGWQEGRSQLSAFLQANARKRDLQHNSDGGTGKDEAPWPPRLEILLEQTGELSPYSLILGICEDGLPFLIDLTNPAPGSLLIVSDHGGGKTRLMRALLASAGNLSTPGQVIYYGLAQNPGDYVQLATQGHCQEIKLANQANCHKLIHQLADIVETRRRNRPDEPFIILAIDDLTACLNDLSKEDFERFYWLLRHGPRSFVWTIGALSAEESSMIQPQILSAFRTRLVGHIHDDGQAAVLSQDEHLDARWIEKGVQFCVPYGDQWLPFWICDPLDKRENRSAGTVDKESPGQTDPADGDALGALRSWNERLNTSTFSKLSGLENLEEKQIFQENRVTRDDPVHDKPVPANGNEPENPNGKPNRPAFSAGHRERSSHPLSPYPFMVNRSAVFPRTEQSLQVERFSQPSALTNREVDSDGSSRQLDDDQSRRSARTKFSDNYERSAYDLIDYSKHSKIKADASLEPGQDTDLEQGDNTEQDGLLSYEQVSNDDQVDNLEDEFEYEYVDEDDPLVDPLDDLIDDDQNF